MIRKFSDIFGGFLAKNFNECLDKGFFQVNLNVQKLYQCIKKIIKRIRITTDLSVFCLIYKNYMKGVCINKSMNILNHFYQSFNVVSDKDSVHNTVF